MMKTTDDIILDFGKKVLSKLNGFEVWEAENSFCEEDDCLWNNEALEVFKSITEEYEIVDRLLLDLANKEIE